MERTQRVGSQQRGSGKMCREAAAQSSEATLLRKQSYGEAGNNSFAHSTQLK